MTDTLHYYKIYDDKEELNYIKSKLNHKEFEEVIKEFESRNQAFVNDSLLKFVQRMDSDAELIEVEEIYY
jgi:hypothetical protein